ncbi:MAG: carboxypeptidase regulatory-like domain-containing protein [bacterium]
MVKEIKNKGSIVFWTAIVSLVLGGSAGLTAETSEVLEEIRQKYEKLTEEINDMTILQETISPDGEVTSVMKLLEKGEKFRREFTVPSADGPMVSIMIHDGKETWSISSSGRTKVPGKRESFLKKFWNLEKAEIVGTEKVADQDCYVVEVKGEGESPPIKIWFDKGSLDPIKASAIGKGGRGESILSVCSDFKKIGDLQIPYSYRTEMYKGDTLIGAINVKSIEINQDLSDELFDPDEVKVAAMPTEVAKATEAVLVEKESSDWHIVPVDEGVVVTPWNPLEVNNVCLAFDPQGKPAISYYHFDDGLMYLHFDGTKWINKAVDKKIEKYSFPHYVTLAFDTQGNPAILYSTMETLKYAHFNGTEWEIEPLGFMHDRYGGISFALDPQGRPALCYLDQAGLKFIHFKAPASQIPSVVSKGTYLECGSLTFDLQGNPGIVYLDRSAGELKYAYFDGTERDISVVAHTRKTALHLSSLAFDTHHNPGISYNEGPCIKYAHFNGIDWDIQLVIREGRLVSLDFDPEDRPVISYYVDRELKYAHFNGTVWEIETVVSEADFELMSFTLDRWGKAAISYIDSKKYELKLASKKKKYPAYQPMIRGWVKDLDGNPIGSAMVNVAGVGARTKQNGTYKLRKVSPLSAKIKVTKAGYHTRTLSHDLTPYPFAKDTLVFGGKSLILNIILHPKDSDHVSIKVKGKSYQITFVEEDTEKPKESIIKILVYSHGQEGNKSEDQKIELSSLKEKEKKKILLTAQLWYFLSFRVSSNVAMAEILKKYSEWNALCVQESDEKYQTTKQKAERKKKIKEIAKFLNEAKDGRTVYLGLVSGTLGPVGVAKVLVGNVLEEIVVDTILDWVFGEKLDLKAQCIKDAKAHFLTAHSEFKKVTQPLDKFLKNPDRAQAGTIRDSTVKALEEMVDGLKLMKIKDFFEGKRGFWLYKKDEKKFDITTDLKEPKVKALKGRKYCLKLQVPKGALAIKARTEKSPVINKHEHMTTRWDYATQTQLAGQVNWYFSQLVWWWRSGQKSDPANHKKAQDHASLVFPSTLTKPETVYLDLDGKAGRLVVKEMKKYHRYKYVYVNYLMEKSDKIKEIEKPFNNLINLIDNLGKGNEIILTEVE